MRYEALWSAGIEVVEADSFDLEDDVAVFYDSEGEVVVILIGVKTVTGETIH